MKCQVINLHIAKCSVRKPIYIFPNSTPGIPGILLRSAHHEEDYPYQHNSKDCFSNFSSAYKQRDEKCISVQPWEMHFKREEVIFCKMGHEGWGIFLLIVFCFCFWVILYPSWEEGTGLTIQWILAYYSKTISS